MNRAEIEQTIAAARAHIHEIGEAAAERAYFVREEGLSIGQGRTQLWTPGAREAPKHHPVWSDELRQEIWQERKANIETGPPLPVEVDLEKYPPAWTPEMAAAGREEVQAAPQPQRDTHYYARQVEHVYGVHRQAQVQEQAEGLDRGY
jgi:hypothetical protein